MEILTRVTHHWIVALNVRKCKAFPTKILPHQCIRTRDDHYPVC